MTTLELYRQLRAGQVSKDKFIYEVRKDSRIPWVTNLTSYEDSIKILKNKGIISEAYSVPDLPPYSVPQKGITDPVLLDLQQHMQITEDYEKAVEMTAKENGMDTEEIKSTYSEADVLGENPTELHEAHKLTTAQIIDRLSPYDFKIGLAFEINKEKDLRNIDIDKLRERVAKKLQKNPKAYRDVKHPDSKKAIKQDEKSKMIDVKEKNLKDKGNEMTKAKGQTVKANTKSSKSENKKGKPAGVKEMKPSNKTPKGVKKMEVPGKEKILENILARIRKKKDSLVEMYETPVKRDDYKSGQIVKVAENTLGKITNIQGSIIEYVLEGGDTDSTTFNVLDNLNGINQHDDPYKDKKTSNSEIDQMWKDWDKRGEKTFGGMLTDPEHFNKPLDYKNILDRLKKVVDKLKTKKGIKKETLLKVPKTNNTIITNTDAETQAAKSNLGAVEIQNTRGIKIMPKPGQKA